MKNRASMLMSAAALVVSLTAGGAYAANATIMNGALIQNHTIGIAKLTPKAVKQLKGQRGPRGWSGSDGINGEDGVGYAGPAGAVGATGPAGGFDPSKVTYVTGPTSTIFPGDTISVIANCPIGTKGIGGGYFSGIADVGAEIPGTNGYGVIMQNNTSISFGVWTYAVCAAP